MLENTVARIFKNKLKNTTLLLIFFTVSFGFSNVQSATYSKSMALGAEPKYSDNFSGFDYVDSNKSSFGNYNINYKID